MLDELRRTLAGSGAMRDPRIQRDLAKLDRQLEEMRAHRRRVLND